jgi:hypothetical protein
MCPRLDSRWGGSLPLPVREFHPLEAPGLSWRTEYAGISANVASGRYRDAGKIGQADARSIVPRYAVPRRVWDTEIEGEDEVGILSYLDAICPVAADSARTTYRGGTLDDSEPRP